MQLWILSSRFHLCSLISFNVLNYIIILQSSYCVYESESTSLQITIFTFVTITWHSSSFTVFVTITITINLLFFTMYTLQVCIIINVFSVYHESQLTFYSVDVAITNRLRIRICIMLQLLHTITGLRLGFDYGSQFMSSCCDYKITIVGLRSCWDFDSQFMSIQCLRFTTLRLRIRVYNLIVFTLRLRITTDFFTTFSQITHTWRLYVYAATTNQFYDVHAANTKHDLRLYTDDAITNRNSMTFHFCIFR